jgi:hypothetical protein
LKSKILILLILVGSVYLTAQSDFRILSSSASILRIEYTPQISDSIFTRINGIDYLSIDIIEGIYLNSSKFGSPAIPTRIFPIGVPSETGNTIQIISSEFSDVTGRIKPHGRQTKGDLLNSFIYSEDENYFSQQEEIELVNFGEFGLIRGLPMQHVHVNPIQFSPMENRVRVFKKIVFQINFGNPVQNVNYKTDSFLEDVVINFSTAKNWIQAKKAFQKPNVTNSVLSTGRWFRFEAPQEGIYKITRAMLASYGIDASTVNPMTIKIYNNGGKILPEKLNINRPTDLVENAITVVGENDGSFDEGDYILFYGKGINFWDYDLNDKKFQRAYNPYSKQNYYWITSGGNEGKRIQNKSSVNDPSAQIITSTKAFQYWDEDKINIGKSGRFFMGDEFSESIKSRTYTSKVEGILDNQPKRYRYRFVNNSSSTVPFRMEENGVAIVNKNISGFGSYEYSYGKVDSATVNYNGSIPGERSLLKFTYNSSASSSFGYLDFFEIYYERELKAYEDFLIFFSNAQTTINEYRLFNFSTSDINVYDVTDYANVKTISNPIKHSGGEFWFQSSETALAPSKYLACSSVLYKTPENPVEMGNQNLRGINPGAKYIIITHKNFKEQAERLKHYRETENQVPLSTIVIDIDQIFNEFSCGMRDVTAIRDFISYAYYNWSIEPEYVLLFGDGDYDYKNIEGHNKNFVIPYETEDSFDEIDSYCTDDFFARIVGIDLFVDIAIGRLNINSAVDAKIVVDKIISYENNSDRGVWRNRMTLVADDGKTSQQDDGTKHTGQSEDLSRIIPSYYDLKKIYLAAYPTVITGLGRRKPEVNQAIIDAVNNGTLILNFIGHGSPDLWTHEQVFIRSVSIPQFVNTNYFFVTAATCDFGYYDKPTALSATEELVLKENSGAIGVFTSSRPVYSDPNKVLNESFYRSMFSSTRDTMNLPIRLGKAYFETKKTFTQPNDQKFHLFADPALRLQIPQYNSTIDSINGLTTTANIQLKALGQVRIDGVVRRPDNSIWNEFNGEGVLTVFDSERSVPLPEFGNYSMTEQGGIIFKGRVSITGGKFSADFIVPKDISYENRNGKVIFYFYNSNVDGIGFTNNVIIGGTDTSAVNDGNGPQIEIFFDDISYVNATIVRPNSNLLVKLSDETGLNTTGTGLGHKLTGIINDNENNPLDLTNYFTGDLDAGGKSGMINYKFSKLAQGNYKIEVKAWDVFNNASSELTYFKVVEGDGLAIEEVYNYPNPLNDNTTFTFQHNINQQIEVKINIYTVSGRMIQQIENNMINDRFVKIFWDGRDKDGDKVANGTYLYKIVVKSSDGEFNKSVLGKLAVLR